VFRKHAANDIFVDLDAEGMSDLLGDPHNPKRGFRRFISTMAAMSSVDGPLGPGLQRCSEQEKSSRYFRSTNAR
jgi:hypothetical protein